MNEITLTPTEVAPISNLANSTNKRKDHSDESEMDDNFEEDVQNKNKKLALEKNAPHQNH